MEGQGKRISGRENLVSESTDVRKNRDLSDATWLVCNSANPNSSLPVSFKCLFKRHSPCKALADRPSYSCSENSALPVPFSYFIFFPKHLLLSNIYTLLFFKNNNNNNNKLLVWLHPLDRKLQEGRDLSVLLIVESLESITGSEVISAQ